MLHSLLRSNDSLQGGNIIVSRMQVARSFLLGHGMLNCNWSPAFPVTLSVLDARRTLDIRGIPGLDVHFLTRYILASFSSHRTWNY